MKRFNLTIWLGLAIGLAAIGLAAYLEDLNLRFLWHPTAALVVFGGTLGAVIIRRGFDGLKSSFRAVWKLSINESGEDAHKAQLGRLAWVAQNARKKGVRVYEDYADSSNDALVAQGLLLIAEQSDTEKVREILYRRLSYEHEAGLQDAATLEAAGGFAPTFGILGAVLGLIGVLRVLDKPEVLGIGIATAFVATIYGIGAANLLLFPIASRLRANLETKMRQREELADVIIALASNEAPRSIANRYNLKMSFK